VLKIPGQEKYLSMNGNQAIRYILVFFFVFAVLSITYLSATFLLSVYAINASGISPLASE
jgi:hypothetical protein